jgi:hypothetical protein
MHYHSTGSFFWPNVIDLDDFLKRYKTLVEQKKSWPDVEVPYYQNRNHIATDLRYFRFAFELIMTNNVHPNQAINQLLLDSTTNLNYEEYSWSVMYITGAASLIPQSHSDYSYDRDD